MNCSIVVFLVIYLHQNCVKSTLNKGQKKCFNSIKDEFLVSKHERVSRELCAKQAFLKHRISKDTNETTLVSDDAKNYFKEISAFLVPSPTMQTFNLYCSSLPDDCKEQLENNFPVDDCNDLQSILNYLYHNKTLREIPENNLYARSYMDHVSINFKVDKEEYSDTDSTDSTEKIAKKLRSPFEYCIAIHHEKKRKSKKQRKC